MKLLEILSRDAIEPVLSGDDKQGALRGLAMRAHHVIDDVRVDLLTQILMERERLGSTGIGHGVAIPHGKTPDLDHSIVIFGRSVAGVDFGAIDNKPVHLFFMLAAPEASHAGLHLQALARISRLVKDPEFRSALLEAPDADSIWDIIREHDEKV